MTVPAANSPAVPAATPAVQSPAAPAMAAPPEAPTMATPAEAPAAPAMAAPAMATPAEAPAAPTVADTLLSLGRTRASLMATNRQQSAELGSVKAGMAALESQAAVYESQITELQGENATLAGLVATLQQGAKSATEMVTGELAALKIPRGSLMAPLKGGEPPQSESQCLQDAFQKSEDPEERSALWKKMKAIKTAGAE